MRQMKRASAHVAIFFKDTVIFQMLNHSLKSNAQWSRVHLNNTVYSYKLSSPSQQYMVNSSKVKVE